MPYISQAHSPYSALKEPSKNQELWRYMDFSKFASLIQTKSLFLSSLIQFSKTDPWEGFPTPLNLKENTVITEPEFIDPEVPPSDDDYLPSRVIYKQSTLLQKHGENVKNAIKIRQEQYTALRRQFFVNCWHINNSDSDAQWKIYANSTSSLAIVTSYNKLSESIIDKNDIYGSQIFYYDPLVHQTPDGNVFWPVICKRNAFKHEQEFRLIYWDHQINHESTIPPGISIKIGLQTMLEKIIVSLIADNWFLDVLKNFLIQYNLPSIPIIKSDWVQLKVRVDNPLGKKCI